MLPIAINEKFGTLSFYEQLLGKRSGLPVRAMYSVYAPRASGVADDSWCSISGICFEDLLQPLTARSWHIATDANAVLLHPRESIRRVSLATRFPYCSWCP